MMPKNFDAKAYGEAFDLMDNPEVDEDTRKFLRAKVQEFEQRKPQLATRTLAEKTGDASLLFTAERQGAGIGGSASFGESGLEAMRRAGINRPMSREQYSQQREALKEHAAEKKDLTELGARRETYVQPTTMPEQTAQEMRQGLADFEQEHPYEVPPEAAAGSMQFGPEGQPYLAGDVATSSFDDIDKEAEAAKEKLGLFEIDRNLPSASQRKDLYAEPEFLPNGTGLVDLTYAERFYEPPIEVARAALRSKLGMDAEDVTERDEAYKRFADAMWQEARAKAEATGKPIVRVEYMTDEKWKNSKSAQNQMVHGAAEVMPRALALQLGAGKALTGGITSELTAGAMGRLMNRDVTREFHDIEERHPYLTGGGMVLGAMTPGGAANRVYSTLAGKTPSMARSALAGAGTGAAESVAQDVVHNAGERAFARDPRLQGNITGRAGEAALFGAGGGILGNLIGDLAARRVRGLREGDVGPTLARAEAGGVETAGNIEGIRLPPGMQSAARQAAAEGRQPLDVMLDQVTDPMAAAALKDQLATIGSIEAEKAGMLGPKTKLGRQKASLSPLAQQVDEELSRLFDDTGRQLPAREADRKALGRLAAETLEVKVVPAAKARSAVASFKGGGRKVTGERLATMLNQAPEMVEMVRDAQKAAMEGGAKAVPKRAQVDIAGASTERDIAASTARDTMLPPPEGGTMRSPPFTARGERPPNVSVDSPAPYDLVGETNVGYAVGEVPGHVYVVGPRKLTPQQLQDTISSLSDMVDEGKSTDLYKRLRDAALKTRDKFKAPGVAPRVKGKIQLENLSAKNAEWESRLAEMQRKNEAAGLPREMKPEAEAIGGPGLPALTAGQAKKYTNMVRGYGSGAGREMSDEALLGLAKAAGKESELKQIGSYLAAQQLKEKSRLRGVIGLNRGAVFTSSPGEVLALRADPAMKALSKQLPNAPSISAELRDLLRAWSGKPAAAGAAKGARLSPMEDLRAGTTGMLSARQLGPASAAGHHRRQKVFINQLSPAEQKLLLRLVEISQREPQRAASGE